MLPYIRKPFTEEQEGMEMVSVERPKSKISVQMPSIRQGLSLGSLIKSHRNLFWQTLAEREFPEGNEDACRIKAKAEGFGLEFATASWRTHALDLSSHHDGTLWNAVIPQKGYS